MKKVFPYCLFSTTSLIVSSVLSRILGFSLMNSWQAGIVLALVVGPYCVFVWKLATEYKDKHPILNILVKIWLSVWLIGWALATAIFVVAAFLAKR